MTNKDKIRAINLHQNYSMVHPLTCGRDSSHGNLEPSEKEGEVVLECPACDYIQEHIPMQVLGFEQYLNKLEWHLREELGIYEGPTLEAIDYARERADEAN